MGATAAGAVPGSAAAVGARAVDPGTGVPIVAGGGWGGMAGALDGAEGPARPSGNVSVPSSHVRTPCDRAVDADKTSGDKSAISPRRMRPPILPGHDP